MKIALDEKPGLFSLLLYGLQWWVVSLPCVIIMGVVVGRMHYGDIAQQSFYMQKLFGLVGVATVVQVLWGHRLPLVVGPATILLVGITASLSSGIEATYSAIFAGGVLLAALGCSGALARVRFFFTPRIVTVILVLIAFTLAPTILRLVLADAAPGTAEPAWHMTFALLLVLALVLCNTCLPGVWKSMTVILGVGGGTLAYALLFSLPTAPVSVSGAASEASFFIRSFDLQPGTLLSFVFCFFALLVNELGSVESVGHMLGVTDMEARIRRGVGLQGATNMAAGALGVIGPVDYSLSAGVIGATGCASRYTLVPAGVGLFLCAFFPSVVLLLSAIPSAVMGALMLYLMASQLASGLMMMVQEKAVADFRGALTVGLPLMVGLIVAFAQPEVFFGFPDYLRPIVGNGFVMGAIAVLLLEHVIFRQRA